MSIKLNFQPIPSRLKNVAKDGYVAGTEDIIDDKLGKTQELINAELNELINGAGGVVDIINNLSNMEEAIDNVDRLAEIFNAALIVNTEGSLTKFAIVSENEYEQLKDSGHINENVIYFCYEPNSIDI